MKSIYHITLVSAILLISNCSAIVNHKPLSKIIGVQTIIDPIDKKSSAIAITVDQNMRRKLLIEEKLEIKKVYFVELKDKNDSLKQNDILSSNYYFVPFMAGFQAEAIDNFLLNVKPGVYAAVGASADGVFLYFPEEVIRQSIVEVNSQELVYMGEFKLNKLSYKRRSEPDEYQKYYRLLFGGGNNGGSKEVSHRNVPQFHAPKVKSINRSNDLEATFLRAYLKIFGDTKWRAAIENRLVQLE